MIRELFILLFFGIVLAGCLTSQPAETGTLQLTSAPSGADIYLDNQYRGKTPGSVSGIVPGNHSLEIRLTGYSSWSDTITVLPGTSNYFAALTAQSGDGEPVESLTKAAVPATISLGVSRELMIVSDSNIFSGTSTGTGSVSLTIYGPGSYANGIFLDEVKTNSAGLWSYTWRPGSKIQSGIYTVIASDPSKTISDRKQFTVIGDGVVTVTPSSYAVATGETVTLSGRCTTGAPSVRLRLFGPERFESGIDLGILPVTAEHTWSFRYTTDITMPPGVYTISVNDIPETTSGTSQFTIGFAS